MRRSDTFASDVVLSVSLHPSASVASSAPRSANDDRIGVLDGWRGLAILLVLQSHFLPAAGFNSGYLGVSIFFSLSGMLMSEILFVRRVPLATFYKRRISRIVPAFLLFVCTVYGIAAWTGLGGRGTEFLSTLLFLRTYIPATPDIWSTDLPIGHLWSLNVEEHCYIFLSLLTVWAALRGREAWVLGFTVLAAMVTYYVYLRSPTMAASPFEIRTETASAFLLASAGYHLVKDRVVGHVRPWMPLLAFAIAALAYLPHAHWWEKAVIAPLALAFAVNHLQQASHLLRAALESLPMRQLGIWSYSLYLWQQPFYTYKSSLPPGLAFVGAMLAALLSFYLIERPSREWFNNHW